jgi:hypothetical protein
MRHIRVPHLFEAACGRANRLSCRFVVAQNHHAPQMIEKLVSLWHFLATEISTVQPQPPKNSVLLPTAAKIMGNQISRL